MALTLTSDVGLTDRTITITGTVPDSIGPGYAFRLDDELLILTTFELEEVQYPVWRQLDPDPNLWIVRRAQGSSTLATHSSGTAVRGAADAFTASTDEEPPANVFPAGGGGGSISVTDGTTTVNPVTSIRGAVITEGQAGVAGIGTAVVAGDDPGAIGAGNLWIQPHPTLGYARLVGRDASDANWIYLTPWIGTENDGSVTIATHDGQNQVYMNENEGVGMVSILHDIICQVATGNMRVFGLPSADPVVSGALWIDVAAGRVLKVSAG